MKTIHNFHDFLDNLYEAGMSMGGENSEGIFTLCDCFSEEISWHTQNQETDPWEWRMRVLNEKQDIAYGKVFFQKSGFITRQWYPYFLRIRRRNRDLFEEYEEGNISSSANKIYKLLLEHKELPLHLIKQYGGFSREDKSKFDKAITELQMNFYITMCGRAGKKSKKGEEYGWSSTVFCLTEDFFDGDVLEKAKALSFEDAYEAVEKQVYCLNPDAKPEKVRKFITGMGFCS